MLSKRKTKELGVKTTHGPPSQNDPLVNKLEYRDIEKTL